MPIKARFEADFSSFVAAVQKAQTALRGFETEGVKGERAMNRLADSLSGSKIPQAIERTSTSHGTLTQSLRQFDNALGATGINITSMVRGLEDISSASGKTARELGGIATAGLAVAAGFAGWRVGRQIAELTGSDKIIGDLTAKLFGMGDVAKEQAAAGADVLARASKNAGRAITDMAAAIKINEAAATKANDAISRLQAPAALAKQLADWRGELDKLQAAGVLEAFTKDLASQNFTQKDLSERYRISTEAIGLFAGEQRTAAAATKKSTDAFEAHAKAIQDLRDRLSGQGAIKAAEQMTAALTHTIPIQDMTRAAQDDINKTMGAAIDVYRRHGQVAPRALRDVWAETQALVHASDLLQGALDHANASMKASEAIAQKNFDAFGKWALEMPHLNRELGNLASRDLSGLKLGPVFDVPGHIPKRIRDITGEIDVFSGALSQLVGVSSGAFGSIVRDLDKVVGSFQAARKAAEAFEAATTKAGKAAALISGAASVFGATGSGSRASRVAGGAVSGATVGAIFGPWGLAIGAAAGALTGLFRTMSAGRDVVKEFAATFQHFNLDTLKFDPGGGFIELHKKLSALGAEGERLWIALTQGVGRNNPTQAVAIIELINTALADLKQKADEAGAAAAKEAGTITASHQKALDAIAGMNNEMQRLFDSIKDEAPEETMGVVERQTRERIAAIEKERDQAQKALDDTVESSAIAAKKAGDIIDEALASRLFHIRVKADIEGLEGIRGGRIPAIEGFQTGTGGRYRNFGSGTLAMLHGREKITPIGAAGGESDIVTVPISLELDGETILHKILRVVRDKRLNK